MKFKVEDMVRILTSTGSEEKNQYIGEIHKIVEDDGYGKYSYKLDGISEYFFSKEELELIEEIKSDILNEKWLGKKYEMTYFQSKYEESYGSKIFHAKGKLINIDHPFIGRFFIENENGALEIIPMMGVIEMREVGGSV